MDSSNDGPVLSRRDLLKASGGAVAVLGLSTTPVHASEAAVLRHCSDASLEPEMTHYDGGGHCADDHPVTERLQTAVADSLERTYPTVGSLIDHGYVPYFDFLTAESGDGWSHWLNPAFLADDTVLDPARPESVLVDHRWWRPIGVMFVATRNGNRVDPPPTVYGDDCAPWHAHTGAPGVSSWLKYWLAYGDPSLGAVLDFPCRTPWMMHVWAQSHPDSVYAHHAPPSDSRGGPPAESAGFDTDAVPGEDLLGPDVLPDAVLHRARHLL